MPVRMLPPGVPGLLALGGVTLVGPLLGAVYTLNNYLPPKQKYLVWYGVSSGLCAAYFWTWALINSVRVNVDGTTHFDGGVISFLFPLAAAASLLIWQPEESRRVAVLLWQRWCALW